MGAKLREMFKEWNKSKTEVEDSFLSELRRDFDEKKLKEFRNCLQTVVLEFKHVYAEKPGRKSDSVDKDFLSNHKLKELFTTICQTESSKEYIEVFLTCMPILNEDLRYSDYKQAEVTSGSTAIPLKPPETSPERSLKQGKPRGKPIEVKPETPHKRTGKPLHVAIKAKAFSNVKALLEMDGIDVNAECRSTKHTPLVMLFTGVESKDFAIVKELVEVLAKKGADINLGFFQTHPLSALCKTESINESEKKELVRFCLEKFECDVDSFYNGNTRDDLVGLGISDQEIRHVLAKVDCRLLKTLITAGKEDEFETYFQEFYKSIKDQPLEEVYELLDWATLKGRSGCVESIFGSLKRDKRYRENITYQIELSTKLKQICQNGFSSVLDLYLSNIKSRIDDRVDSEKEQAKYSRGLKFDKKSPILLICVKELLKKRAPERLKCFQLVLSDRRISAEKRDHQKQTALHFAVEHGMDEEAKRIMIKRSPYLGSLNKNTETPLHRMKLEVLKPFLNSLVTFSKDKDGLQVVLINLKGLIPPKRITPKYGQIRDAPKSEDPKENNLDDEFQFDEKPEIDVFYCIAQSEKLRPLLRHPVISTCLRIKWLFLRWVIYVVIILNLLFTVSFCFYSQWDHKILKAICFVFLLYYIIFTLAIILADQNIVNLVALISRCCQTIKQTTDDPEQKALLPESSQPPSEPDLPPQPEWKPLQVPQWMNPFYLLNRLLGPTIIILAALSLLNRSNATLSALILLSGIDNIIHFKLLPSTTLSASIIMLETVSRSLLKILLSYLVLLFTFGISFHVLFSDNETVGGSQRNGTDDGSNFDSFATVQGSLLKSLVMMIGEFNAQDIPFYRSHLSYLTFLFFMFLVTLVIMNLANGLAVSDVTELRQSAELDTLTSWVSMLHRFENGYSLRFPSIRRKTSFYNHYEPKVIIKTSQGNMIQLVKETEPAVKKPTGNESVVVEVENHENTTREERSEQPNRHNANSANPKANPNDKDSKLEVSLQIFPFLKYCHTLSPEVYDALREIVAENAIKAETSEQKTEKKTEKKAKTATLRRNQSISVRQRWHGLKEDIKNGKLTQPI